MSKLAKWFWIIVCQWILSIVIFVVLVLSLWNSVDYWRTANWIQVEGVIVSLKITNFDGSEPKPDWSGEGDLWCRYTYTFNGSSYSGNQIGVETFCDSSPRSRRYRQLKALYDGGKPVRVWVNPAAPTEAALFREKLSEMYFGPAIGVLWFGVLYWNYKHQSKSARSQTNKSVLRNLVRGRNLPRNTPNTRKFVANFPDLSGG
jgi:hypothetical protein